MPDDQQRLTHVLPGDADVAMPAVIQLELDQVPGSSRLRDDEIHLKRGGRLGVESQAQASAASIPLEADDRRAERLDRLEARRFRRSAVMRGPRRQGRIEGAQAEMIAVVARPGEKSPARV